MASIAYMVIIPRALEGPEIDNVCQWLSDSFSMGL
jgi:hypothetical protein